MKLNLQSYRKLEKKENFRGCRKEHKQEKRNLKQIKFYFEWFSQQLLKTCACLL